MSEQYSLGELAGTSALVTGGLGFIGSNLSIELLRLGVDVTVLDSLETTYGGNRYNLAPVEGQVNIITADMNEPGLLPELVAGKSYIFNLAGQTSHLDSMKNPDMDRRANVDAQLALMEACRLGNPEARVVFASTRQIYGIPEYLPVDELHPLQPVDINGVHKLAGEMYHRLYARVHGIPITILRLTNTYGPRMRVKDDRQTFLGTWIRRLLDGIPLKIFGEGTQLRDFNHVDDAVKALLLCATRDEAIGQVYNLGSSEVFGLKDLAALMVDIHGGGSYELVAFPSERKRIDIGDYYSDFSAIAGALSWSPQVDMAEGLASTIEYFRAHGDQYWN